MTWLKSVRQAWLLTMVNVRKICMAHGFIRACLTWRIKFKSIDQRTNWRVDRHPRRERRRRVRQGWCPHWMASCLPDCRWWACRFDKLLDLLFNQVKAGMETALGSWRGIRPAFLLCTKRSEKASNQMVRPYFLAFFLISGAFWNGHYHQN